MCSTKTTFQENQSIQKVEWSNPDVFPDLIGQNGFSVDVLIYSDKIDEHTIGWYEYKTGKWWFLCNEQSFEEFKWRYFNNQIDKYNGESKSKKGNDL